jgi:hypothetical protein
VTIISSSQAKVDAAVGKLNNSKVNGAVGDVRNEEAFVEILRSFAPLDHVVFSGVDMIIRGKLEELDLGEASHLFGVKFWGAVIIGKGERVPHSEMCNTLYLKSCSFGQIRHHQPWGLSNPYFWHGCYQTGQRGKCRRGVEWWSAIADCRTGK